MNVKLINIKSLIDVERALREIGCHPVGMSIMTPKGVSRSVKMTGVKAAYANIMKLTMLSVGGEVATCKGTIDSSIPTTDVVMFGTLKHFKLFSQNMEMQTTALQEMGKKIWNVVSNSAKNPHRFWKCRGHTFDLSKKTLIMGILNVTPDSFSDGGRHDTVDAAMRYVEQSIKDGAGIIDVGGESTRPGSRAVDPNEELARIIPIITEIKANFDIPVSVDTYKSYVAEECLRNNVQIINDIYAFRKSPDMIAVIKEYNAGVVLMHMKGNPQNMQDNPTYDDVVSEICDFFEERIRRCQQAGISTEQIIIDPGIGFGKTLDHNLRIFRELGSFSYLRCPLLMGVSRKFFIGKILGLSAQDREEGTVAAVCASVLNGARIVRVHDVKRAARGLKIIDSIMSGSL